MIQKKHLPKRWFDGRSRLPYDKTEHFTTTEKQLLEQDRGDFEASEDATEGVTGSQDVGIPEVNLELKSEPIVAKTRKLKAVWTPELAQDLNAYHSIDAEAELTSLLSEIRFNGN